MRQNCHIGSRRSLAALLFVYSILGGVFVGWGQESPWEEDSVMRTVQMATHSTITTYEDWRKEWDQAESPDRNKGDLINSLTELQFLVAMNALRKHSNPEMLYRCLTFLSRSVPDEYDDIWRLVFLEMADIDEAVTEKANQFARENNLPTLAERSMRPGFKRK